MRTQQQILEDIKDVECGLSPENLTCDGECPKRTWKKKERQLLARKSSLIKELGRIPTFQEIYGFTFKEFRGV